MSNPSEIGARRYNFKATRLFLHGVKKAELQVLNSGGLIKPPLLSVKEARESCFLTDAGGANC